MTVPRRKAADKPTCDAARDGTQYVILDPLNAADCETGGGSSPPHVCICDGATATWKPDGIDPLLLQPGAGWVNTQGTATLVHAANLPAYWQFLDNSAKDRIELSMPLPATWRGRALNKLEFWWATSGTSTTNMTVKPHVADYTPGTDLASGTGNAVYTPAASTVTPTGTAESITLTDFGPSGSFAAGAELLRVYLQRESDVDTNTEGLRVYGVRLEVA